MIKINSRSLPLCVLASAFLCSAASMAQQAAPAARIVNPIDESQLVTLRGSFNPSALGATDRGPVSADLPMAGLTLVLSRSADQQAAFNAFVASQYDLSSPNFHQWLTPQQIAQEFGPAQADISTLSGWLGSHGFAVTNVGADGMTIQFRGTAGQVENVFHTQIHNLSVNGKMHIANLSDAQIPAALAPVVAGIKGLHNFLPHPLHRLGNKVEFNPEAHAWVKQQTGAATGQQALSGAAVTRGALRAQAPGASANFTPSPQPNFSFPYTGSTAIEEDVAPYDFATMYNLTPLWTNSITGTGQTITVIGTSDIDLTDVSNFKTAFGLPAGKTPVIAHGPDGDPGICSGNSNPCNSGDLDENSLDVEWSGAVAPGAQVVLVTDAYLPDPQNPTEVLNDPIFDGAQWAIDNAFVSGTAVYGSRIVSLSYGECELFNGTASNVAYNNLWQTAAAAGIAVFVATGDSGSASCDQGGDEIGYPYEAQYGATVSGFASSPYDTAVGGTDFSWCQPSIIQSGSSAGDVQGCSSSNAAPYWSTTNSSTTQASAKGYVPETPWNDTCENPLDSAFLESVATYFAANGLNLGSISAPEEACNYAYENYAQIYEDTSTLTEPGEMLAPFVDTVGGSGGASNCVVNNADTSDSPACTAGATNTGSTYDNLTLVNNGWPKPSWQTSAASLGVPADEVRDLPDVSFFAGDGSLDSATLICVSNEGASCTNVSVTGGVYNGTSTSIDGALEVGGTSVATPEMAGVMALINQKAGGAQGSPNAEFYNLAGKQTYSSCSAEKGSTSSACYFNDIDTGTNAMACAPNTSVIEGGAEYAGNGAWVAGPQELANASPNCTVVDSGDLIGTLTGFSAATGYDQASGLGSLNIANVVNGWTAASGVTTGTNTAAVAIGLGGVTSITESQSLTVTVTVSGHVATPTGSVILQANEDDYNSTQALSGGTTTFTIPANTFTSAGTVTLTVTYSGDSNYAAAGTSTTFTVSGTITSTGTFALAAITSPAAIAPGATASATATVTGSGGYAGTVSLSCALTSSPSGAVNLPGCSPSGTITLSAAATSGSATLAVSTTPATVESDAAKKSASNNLARAGSGALLALLVFFGIPARRKAWRAMLGMVVLLITLGSLAACGGSSGSGTTTIPGTSAGTYTFTVTATGNPAISSTQTQTFNVVVN
jgi:subtilase family serine protease